MNRYKALSIIEIKLLQGFWLTRKEIMVLTDYSSDVTHLVQGLHERGVPVLCVKGKPANKSKWGLKPSDLTQHMKNPYMFRTQNIERVTIKRKENAIKNVLRIENQYGANLILNTMQLEK
ncbi:hypothetical protein CGJ08_14960 [Vibrio parahaemolyticus]|uniref:hypothetical protein n=1 Tax=Vibrio parahaemolyticus TaxID=670 RepID=UPI0011228EB6|nr:hypothetical protein [Vibrio parahaemolyticus]TOG11945.1 hypothetical protein CGJ08_14960 [Vibrio parahaemolyticus]TOP34924.1 hypothetical protein CGH19_03025 [Vibrio parahaemolyticus]